MAGCQIPPQPPRIHPCLPCLQAPTHPALSLPLPPTSSPASHRHAPQDLPSPPSPQPQSASPQRNAYKFLPNRCGNSYCGRRFFSQRGSEDRETQDCWPVTLAEHDQRGFIPAIPNLVLLGPQVSQMATRSINRPVGPYRKA